MKKRGGALIYLVLLCAGTELNAFLILSIPKAGTHLLAKAVHLILGDDEFKIRHVPVNNTNNWVDLNAALITGNNMHLSHAPATIKNIATVERCNVNALFIIRDPRDQIISFAYFIKESYSWKSKYFKQLSIKELIDFLISKISFLVNWPSWNSPEFGNISNVGDFYTLYLSWQESSAVYTTTFEKLAGPKSSTHYDGQLYDEGQIMEIVNIASHLGISISYDRARRVAERLWGNTHTFREGKVGSWKEHFTGEQKNAFKKVAGQLLIDLGYEKNLSW